MKRKLLSWALMMIAFGFSQNLQAQFSESFEGSFPPSGWTVINNGDSNTWYQAAPTSGSAHSGNTVARIDYDADTAHSDYLITSQFTVLAGTSDYLAFYARSGSSTFPEEFNVLLSTTGNTAGDFTTTLDTLVTPSISWQQYTYDLSAYIGQTIYIAFHAVSMDQFYLYMDDVVVSKIPTCFVPSDFGAVNITTTTADIFWTTGGASDWNVEYGLSGFSQGMGIKVSSTNDTLNITGLSAGTSYDFYVRDSCGPGDVSNWAGPFSLQTNSLPLSLPYYNGFEGGMGKFANDPANNTDWTFTTALRSQGSRSLYNNYSSSEENILYLSDSINLSDYSNVVLSFDHIAKTEGTYDECYVEYSSDGGNTWQSIPDSNYVGNARDYDNQGYFHEDSYSGWGTSPATPDNTWWKRETFLLSDLTTGFISIRFRLSSDFSVARYGWLIDNLAIENPSCLFPTGIGSGEIGPYTANFYWTGPANGTGYNVEYDTAGFVMGAGRFTTSSANDSITLTGLSASTSYEFYIQSECGATDTSSWIGPFTFTTTVPCPVPTDISSSDTTDTSVELNWTSVNANSWTLIYGEDGFDPDSAGTSVNVTSLPFTLSGLSQDTEYDYYVVSDCGPDGDSDTSNVHSFTTLQTCPDPKNLGVTEITSSGLIFYWSTDLEHLTWDLEYGPEGFTPGGGTMLNGVNNDSVSISSLNPDMTYDFYVKANCITEGSNWIGPYTASTLGTPLVLPYYNSFEGVLDKFRNDVANDQDWMFDTLAIAGDSSVMNRYLASSDNILYLPNPVDLSVYSNAVLSFDHIAKTEGSYDECYVEYSDDGGMTWQSIPDSLYLGASGDYDEEEYFHEDSYPQWGTTNSTPDNSWWKREVFLLGGLSSGYINIRFRLDSDGSNQWYGWLIDNLLLDNPSCMIVNNLGVFDIGADTAMIYWTDNASNSSGFNIEYGLAGFTLGSGSTITSINDTTVLTGLSPETDYEYYVQADCGSADGTSMWMGPYSFTTIPSCPDPEDLGVFGITTSGVVLYWTSSSEATSWDVEYGPRGFGQGTGTLLTEVANDSTSISGLNHGTYYDFYVLSNCDPVESGWTGPYTVRTQSLPLTLPYYNGFEGTLDKFINDPDNADDWDFNDTIVSAGNSSAFNLYSNSSDNILYLPNPIDLRVYANAVLSFDHIAKTEGTYDECYVEYSGDGGLTWQSIPDSLYLGNSGDYDEEEYFHEDSYSDWGTSNTAPDSSWWKREVFLLAGLSSGYVNVRFRLSSDGSAIRYGWLIDSLSIENPSCLIASQLGAMDIGVDSAVIYWTDNSYNSSGFNIEYGPEGFTLGNGNVTSSTINTTVLRRLNATSSYDFYVQTDCGSADGTSQWAGPYTFITESTCFDPTDLGVTNIATTSADLYWTTGGASNWQVAIGPKDFVISRSDITAASNDTLTITGLQLGTLYEFYVRDSCGQGDVSFWTGPFAFYTQSLPLVLPYYNSFEGTLDKLVNDFNNTDDWGFDTLAIAGDSSVHNSHGPDATNILFLPNPIDLGTYPEATMSFHHIAKTEGGYDGCYVEYTEDGGQTWQSIPDSSYLGNSQDYDDEGYFHEDSYTDWGTSDVTPDSSWWKREVFFLKGLSAGNINIRFRLTSDGSIQRYGWLIDSLLIENPSCLISSNLGASDIGPDSAVVFWTNNASNNVGFNIEYGPTGFTPGNGSTVSSTNDTTVLTGLNAVTSYDFYVQTDCGSADGTSHWTGPYSFVTEPTCFQPSGMGVTAITTTSADVYWSTGGANNWQVAYGLEGFAISGSNIVTASDDTLTITGLQTGTLHEFYVRDSCGPGDVSMWSGPFAFNTKSLPLVLPYYNSFEGTLDKFVNDLGNDDDWSFDTLSVEGDSSVHNSYSANADNILYLPNPIDLRAYPEAMMSFYHIAKTEGTYDECYVEYSEDEGLTWQSIPDSSYVGNSQDYNDEGYFHEDSYADWGTSNDVPDSSWWKKETFVLGNLSSGYINIRFRLSSDGSAQRYGWLIDSLLISVPAGACIPPSHLSATVMGCSEAALSWNSSSANPNSIVEYGLAGFTPGTGTAVGTLNFVSSPQMISNLVPATAYEFYVADTCAVDTTIWIGPQAFTTLPGAVIADFSFIIQPATTANYPVTFDASNSIGAYSYTWDFGDGSTPMTVTNAYTMHNYATTGDFTVELIVDGLCGSDTITKEVAGVSIMENAISKSLEVYPNPTRDMLSISFYTGNSEPVDIRVLDLSGKVVLHFAEENVNGSYRGQLDLSPLAKGVYILNVESSSLGAIQRVVKQ